MEKKLTTPKMILGTADAAADLRYASGFWAPDPVVFLDGGKGRRLMVVSALEAGRARATVRATVLQPADVVEDASARRDPAMWALGAARCANVNRVCVSGHFPIRAARLLEENGVEVEIAEGGLYPERAVKTARELRFMREAQGAAVSAVGVARRMIAGSDIHTDGTLRCAGSPLTSERVREAIEIELLRHECSADETIVAGGPQGADPHERGSGPLRAGESIIVDVFPHHRRHGYCGDITRTFVRGTPPKRLRAMYRAVKEAQEMALATVRSGVTGKRVHRDIDTLFTGLGFPKKTDTTRPEGFFHGTGHGIGLEVHEAPTVSPAGGRLKTGNVVTIEPGLYYPDIGGVRIEDTVVVEKSGCRALATMGKALVIGGST